MKTILTYGTFDFCHFGHQSLLWRARALGDRLLVGVSTDKFAREKGKVSYWDSLMRAERLRALLYVDDVFPEHSFDQKKDDIKRFDADLLVMGSDWEGEFDNLGIETKYLLRTEGISSTQLRAMIKNGN